MFEMGQFMTKEPKIGGLYRLVTSADGPVTYPIWNECSMWTKHLNDEARLVMIPRVFYGSKCLSPLYLFKDIFVVLDIHLFGKVNGCVKVLTTAGVVGWVDFGVIRESFEEITEP